MQGCKQLGLILVCLLSAGCSDGVSLELSPVAPTTEYGSQFDPQATGSIRGQVSWQGDLPKVPPFQVHACMDYVNADRLRGEHTNPYDPKIELGSRGVGGALVMLRRVKPELAKPWDHAPVCIEMFAERIIVSQDALTVSLASAEKQPAPSIGIVQRGAEVRFVNRDVGFHTLRARSAAFFTLPFVVADRETRRQLTEPGFVELSEGGGLYWRRAHLVVMDHPYATITDYQGRFHLKQVPVGDHELTVWMPNWHIVRQEREPETGIVSRVTFGAALDLKQKVHVQIGETTETTFAVGLEQFKQ